MFPPKCLIIRRPKSPRKRAHARGRVSAMLRVWRQGPPRPPAGLLGHGRRERTRQRQRTARHARNREIRALLEAALENLQEGGP